MNKTIPSAVSVIVPTYNRADYLGQAIDSILSQTFVDFEIVVVDDGSTDATAALIESMADPRIRYIYQDNRGISGARNTGISAAEGRYIAFLDSDDIWLPELLEIEVPLLDEDNGIGGVYAKAEAMDQHGQPQAGILGTRERFPGEQLKSMLYGCFGCLPTTVLRRECFDVAGLFDETLKVRNDWDMFLRITQNHRFRFVDRVLARYRCHPGRTTGPRSSAFEAVAVNRVAVLNKFYSQKMLSTAAVEVRSNAYSNAFIEMGIQYLSAGDRRLAGRSFQRAIKQAPGVATLSRIAERIILYRWLLKTSWGSRWVERLAAAQYRFRRKWKTRPEA